MPPGCLFDNADWNDFEARNRLQGRKIGFAELPTVDGRLAAQVEKRRHCNLRELRKRIVDLRFLNGAGNSPQPQTSTSTPMAIAKRNMKSRLASEQAPLIRNSCGHADNPGTSRVIDRIDAVSLF